MHGRLTNKQIALGVTGGIAAYKSADLTRRLRDAGAQVRVVMTSKAKEFITPLTMQAVSGNPVHDDLFDLKAEAAMGHIELGHWADMILVAPASADFIARLIQGEANDLLTTLCLVSKAPIVLAPAMNQAMWTNPITQAHLKILQEKQITVLGPAEGLQACGDVGPGRMMEPMEIVEQAAFLFQTGSLMGRKVLITAGPTREAIDPVRFITNASSGKMGHSLAQAAFEAGAEVTLISGPVHLPKPERISRIDVITAEEMLTAVQNHVEGCDLFLGVAAVGDYFCRTVAAQKIAKNKPTLTLELERGPDIITFVANLTKKPIIIGFAAETQDLLIKAKAKLMNKKMDMIIANQVGVGLGIDQDENTVSVLWQDHQQFFEQSSKQKLARELIALIAKVFFNVE